MFTSVLVGGLSGWLLRHFSGQIHGAIGSGLRIVRDWLITLDDTGERLLPAQFRFSPEAHAKFDSGITRFMAWVESNVFSKVMIERICYILGGNKDKTGERLKTLFLEAAEKAATADEIPSELLPVINQAKHELTVEHVRAVTSTLPKELQPTQAHINAAINAIAPEIGRTILTIPAENLGRTADHQKLIEELRLKNAEAQ